MKRIIEWGACLYIAWLFVPPLLDAGLWIALPVTAVLVLVFKPNT